EKEHDEGGLQGGNGESDNDVEAAKIHEGRPNRGARQKKQRQDDHQVRGWRYDVFGMFLFRHASLPTYAGQSDITAERDRSTRCPRSANTNPQYPRAYSIVA